MPAFIPRLAVVLALVLIAVAPAAAQSIPKPNEWLPPGWDKSIPLPGETGEPIKDDQRVWAYVAAVVGFLLVFAATRVAVRILAYVLIALLVVGGIALLCTLIDDGRLKTWPMLLITTAVVAASCGATSTVIGLFTLKQDKDGE